MSKKAEISRALRIGMAALCATGVYELAKHICFPRISVATSHIITIFLSGCLGFWLSFVIRLRNQACQRELLRLAAIVQCSDDAIVSTDLYGIVSSWNRGAEQLYGYSAAEALGCNISFCIPRERHAALSAFLQRVASGETIERFDTQRLTKNGTIIDVSLAVSPIIDDAGNLSGLSGIARDITAHCRRETQLDLQSAMLEAAANGIVITDRKGTIVWCNRALALMTGYSREEMWGKNLRLLKSGKQPESYYAELWTTITSGRVWQGEIVNRRKDGTNYTEEMTITPVTQDTGRSSETYFIAIKQDVTESRQVERALRKAEDKYRALFEDAVIGVVQTTPEGHPLSVNRAFAEMLGYDSPEQLLAEASNQELPRFVDPRRMDKLRDELGVQGVIRGTELEVYCRNRTKKWVLANLRAVRDTTGTVVRHEGTVEDVTDRKVAEERVQFLAYYDALTGLPNRTLLRDRLSKALAGARRKKSKVALLFLDLDRFKNINDSLGHSVGDILLQDVAERLQKWGREQDTVARLGGDEFLIVLTEIRDIPDVAVAAERLMDTMAAEFVVQGQPLSITCSLGISIFPEHGRDGETLIKNADAAMYSAKDGGRNNFQLFTEDMNAEVLERLTLESSLRVAIARSELFLEYQPQMDIASGRITGLEALLRWQHPEMGLIPPDSFIRIAENCGLVVDIGEWVLRTACSQARKWQDQGLPAVTVAVNVSAVQFRQDGFCDLIRRVLHETGLAPQHLELELTESLLLSNAEMTFSVLQELKALGLGLAIDDFGTGYSSLSYLKHFPVRKLKIDRSFVRDVAVNADDAAITTAIIGMARSLTLKVIAEGVENEGQMSFLRAHECDEIQGYYFCPPLRADKIADKLREATAKLQAQAEASGKGS
jgi:diguanylate cyclase (GGDEF)-like protein/PAS domain S-box-containing protein